MRYTIEVSYKTGDTFQSYDTSHELGISWENLDMAKEALRRIKEQYEVETDNEHAERWGRFYPEAKFRDPKDFKWYSPKYPEVSIMLPLDDGTEHCHGTPWRGYFEHLYGAEIVPVNDTKEEEGMKFTI